MPRVRNTSRRTHADQSIVCNRRQKMRNPTGIFGLALASLLCCCSELAQAAPYPAEVPANPVFYKRFVRHRPSVEHPELEVYEVRELYYVRRATLPPSTTALPKKKKIIRLADGDIERRIRCDFNPNLAECKAGSVATTPSSTSTSTVPATTSSTSTTSSTTTTTEATTTSSTSTTPEPELPVLPVLPELPEEPEQTEEPTETNVRDEQAAEDKRNEEAEEDEQFEVFDDDREPGAGGEGDGDGEGNESEDDYDESEPDAGALLNPNGSIGGNDNTGGDETTE